MSPKRIATALALLVAVAAGLLAPGAATAHPLGNFTVNHLDVIRVSEDRVDVRWILDQAEIPTFRERDRSPADVLAAKRAEALRGLELVVDGRRVALRPAGSGSIEMPPGQGGLRTTRVELLFTAAADGARDVRLRDATFPDRLGWRGMIVAPGEGTDTTSDLPADEPTRRLSRYPQEVLKSPADQREIRLKVEPGDGAVMAPRAEGGGLVTTDAGSGGADTSFTDVFDDAAAGDGVLILLLAAAFGWGALHALSPGHGKTMVAAYLVGARGTARHAVILGATVTVTHTIGVFALGGITLALSQYLLPEDLYPWLNLVAGLLVLLVGALVLRARLRGVPEGHHHGPGGHTHGPAGHTHSHEHEHEHEHAHARGEHTDADAEEQVRGREPVVALAGGAPEHHDHHGGGHGHGHATHVHGSGPATSADAGAGDQVAHEQHHVKPASVSSDGLRPRMLLAAGASAGLIPCPSALVVLLGAIAQQEIALGMLLIVVFSLGLAATLTALGLAVVFARGLTANWRPRPGTARALAAIPTLSALLIMLVGVLLTVRALPGVV